jgi:hypothetical protein
MAMADLGVIEICWGLASFSPLIDLRRACQEGSGQQTSSSSPAPGESQPTLILPGGIAPSL